MNWLLIAALVCVIIGPFDALYLYIKAQRRRDALKRQQDDRDGRES